MESLGDPALWLRVLERDPGTLEQALKLATRLEALGYGEVEDNWDDLGRRKERFIKSSAANDYAERQGLVSMVEELKSEVERNRKEFKQLRSGEARRGRAGYAAGASGHQTTLNEPVRPAQHPEYPNGGSPAGYWQASPPTPPPTGCVNDVGAGHVPGRVQHYARSSSSQQHDDDKWCLQLRHPTALSTAKKS